MIWLLIVPLIILWAFLQPYGTGQSRRSMRTQRRKARELGIPPEALDYRHRGVPPEKVRIPLWVEVTCGLLALLILGSLFGELFLEWITGKAL